MIKKYKNYIIITFVLTALALYFFSREKKGTLALNTNYFAITDTSQISRLLISTRTDTIVVEEIGDHWMVDRTFNARVKMIKVLLGLFSTIEITAPVSKKIKTQVLNHFQSHAIVIKFETNQRVYKEFEICEPDSILFGTFIRKPGSEDIYVAHIPGYEGKLSRLLPVNPRFWRDNTVFCYKPWEILSIQIEYPYKPEDSFMLDLSNPDKLVISGNQSIKPFLLTKDKIVRYLLSFNSISFEVMPHYKIGLADSLQNCRPYSIITIKSIENQYNKIKTYPITIKNQKEKIDMFKMYAVIQNDSIPVFVKYVDFDPITKSFKELSAN